jgi:hypothetical protein
VNTIINKYYGKLIFPESGEEITDIWLFETTDQIYCEIPMSLHGSKSWDIVHGVFNGKGAVSLVNVFASGGSSGDGGSYRKLDVSTLVWGVLLESVESKALNKLVLYSDALKKWITESYHVDVDYQNHQFKIPEEKEIVSFTSDKFELKVYLNYGYNVSQKNVIIDQNSYVVVDFKEDLSVSDVRVFVYNLEKIILFLTWDNPKFRSISLNGGYFTMQWINKDLDKVKFPIRPRLKYSEIKDSFSEIISKWFNTPRIEPIIDLFQEKCFDNQLSPDRSFMNSCVALESFHKKFINDSVEISDPTPIQNREKIKELIKEDSELLKWFRSKTNFWKNPELYDRLLELKPLYEKIIGDVFRAEPDLILRKIKKTRDKLAHEGMYYTEFEKNAESIIAERSIHFLLGLLIMKEFGINIYSDRENKIAEANTMLRNIARMNDYEGMKIHIK